MKRPMDLQVSITDFFRTAIEGVFWLVLTSALVVGIVAVWKEQVLLFGIAVVVFGLLMYVGYFEPRWVQTKVYHLKLREGVHTPLRLVFLSDFHAGHHKSKSRYDKIFAKVQRLKPDLVLLGGDFVEANGSMVEDLSGVALLKPSLGVYFVLGNHDYWDDPRGVAAALTRYGATELTNTTITLQIGEQSVYLIGVDDVWFGSPRVPVLSNAEIPKILLTHEVDLLFDLPENAVDLVFLGHTHGGQIRLPIHGSLAPLPQFAPAWLDHGLRIWKGMRLLISRGIGESTIRFRFWARPQIIVVELT